MKKRLTFLISLFIIVAFITGCGQTTTEQKKTSTESEVTKEQVSPKSETIKTTESTAFSSISYDADEESLIVTFRDSGTTYYYPDFPYEEWIEFKSAASLGSYFNENIKPNYDYTKKIDGKKETKENTPKKQTTSTVSTAQKHNYVANKNSKKFHYDWCASVDQMKESNKKYYNNTTREVLIADGYKPCKNCNP